MAGNLNDPEPQPPFNVPLEGDDCLDEHLAAPITVQLRVNNQNMIHNVVLSHQRSFDRLLEMYHVCFLYSSEGTMILDFDSLLGDYKNHDGGAVYSLGDTLPDRAREEVFDFGSLLQPEEIPLPPILTSTEFVSENDWKESVLSTINSFFSLSDGLLLERIPPMALVRCSRGGKTRALLEMAHELKRRNTAVVVLFVSFNDVSSLLDSEQLNPLQALLRRIIVQATSDYIADSDKEAAFDRFRAQQDVFDPVYFEAWLGDLPAILLVDELNNLQELKQHDSASASVFGHFVKANFISRANRYMVFSSHVVSALEDFRNYVDRSYGSKRSVILQPLPRISRLSMAQRIDPRLVSVRQAFRCGFIPGLIYDQRPSGRKDAGGNCQKAVEDYNTLASSRPEQMFKGLLKSFITGESSLIPVPLHILFDTDNGDDPIGLLRWIPLHFEYVMKKAILPVDSQLQVVANGLVDLCQSLFSPYTKDKSGDGWEAAFVILVLLRSAAQCPDDLFLPAYWFEDDPVIAYNSYEGVLVEYDDGSKRRTLLSDCKCWSELREGVQVGPGPTIVVLFPNNSAFERYDAFVLFYQNGNLIDSHGFQLKEGLSNPSKPPLPDVRRSFVIKGRPPAESVTKQGGWIIASDEQISRFFGNSGELWTPAYWESFKNN